ncbi:DUF2071 domain-containing protein [Pimelobacter simplex]|uniref:DUF2071 domain-containing protein n=1 Tax=Nocardioides simplex TaxID=2045 RepID=UPI00214FD60A|nr:DUF2071 domain-containing protein [Pimelobacter simplex]UUW90347.1 DUF2071 domain-containing protein [Pimelobacter simplex]UUW94177.1 DUF2071 domain-containing protein [Pimelobacter simplex]
MDDAQPGLAGFLGTDRPRVRWFHAASDLRDFMITTFRVSPERLARHLPAGYVPEVVELAGGPAALVSAVAFRDESFHFRGLPRVAITCGQVNYRAYVRRDGVRGAWFLGTAFDHPTVVLPRRLWGMPWRRERIDLTATWDDGRASWALRTDEATCRASEAAAVPAGLDGFATERDWQALLTHPTVGWYRRGRAGRVGTYSIWHPPMAARHFVAAEARFPFLERLGLVQPGQEPHSLLGQELLPFDIHTPPRRVRGPVIATP